MNAALKVGPVRVAVLMTVFSLVLSCAKTDSHLSSFGPAPYRLDRVTFAGRLASVTDKKERLAILSKRWDQVKLAIAFCDVADDMAFHQSMMQERSGRLFSRAWSHRVDGDLTTPIVDKHGGTVLVTGDCLAKVTISGGTLIHIYGDLNAPLDVGGQCEVVIGGTIRKGAGISGNGIVAIFVGGDIEGYIRNAGSSKTWIDGNVSGEIGTGTPSTRVHVMGNFTGSLAPVGETALLYLDVRGFMPSPAIEKIAESKYTEFNASIGVSDIPPGIYPKFGMDIFTTRWVIHSFKKNTR